MARKSVVHRPRGSFQMLLCLCAAMIMLSVSSARASSSTVWMTRPGTIRNAASLADGSHVYLDAEVVDGISAVPDNPHIVVREWFAPDEKIVVLAQPPDLLQPGQMIDVEGTMTTLADGTRAVQTASLYGYTDSRGTLLFHSMIAKGMRQPIAWPWKTDLTVQFAPESTVSALSEPGTPPDSGGSAYTPVPFTSIGELLNASSTVADGTRVQLQRGTITSTGTDVTYGTYFVMSDDDGSPPAAIRVYYTQAQGVGDRVTNIIAQIETQGTERVLCLNAGPEHPNADQMTGPVSIAAQGTIAWAKTFPAGTQLSVPLTGKIVTCGAGLIAECLYIEEPNRSSGIRVAGSLQGPAYGQIVSVSGTMDTNSTGERYINSASTTLEEGTALLDPLFLPNRGVGGVQPGSQSTIGVFGVGNTGLLVRTSGRITYSGGTYMYIDDGSALNDGSGYTGLRVDISQVGPANFIALPTEIGVTVFVTGISSCAMDGSGNLVPVLRPRVQSDIVDNPGWIAISAPSISSTTTGPVSYTVTYNHVGTITLSPADVTLNKTGDANGAVTVSGEGNTTRTVTISNITGEGAIGISIAANTASDSGGKYAGPAGPSQAFRVEWAPTIIAPAAGSVVDTPTPDITWSGGTFDQYEVHVGANATDADASTDGWDSGPVVGSEGATTTGALLAEGTTYYVFVRVRHANGWSAWSAPEHSFSVQLSAPSDPSTVWYCQ